MKVKKNPKKDLNRNSSLYFSIGLCAMLFISWKAVEWKTYGREDFSLQTFDILHDDVEEVPLTEHIKTIPPPPPPAPRVIEVVDNEVEIEETIIESTETSQEEIIEDIEVVEVPFEVEVPFAVIEDAPIFPGCERLTKTKQKECFQTSIQKFIVDNFQYPEIAQEMGVQGRVNVLFIIDQNGEIKEVRSRGPDKNLIQEAERIIKKLPKMIPGKQRGRAVRVPYGIPISFKLN